MNAEESIFLNHDTARAALTKKLDALREEYFEMGLKLDEVVSLFTQGIQLLSDVKSDLKKAGGWGY